MATMNNFRAEDMPSAPKKNKDDAKPAVEAEEPKVEAPKKAAPKKAPAKKAEPKAEEVTPEPQNVPPTQTNTETHGVGPSTVEGGNTPAVDAAEEETK